MPPDRRTPAPWLDRWSDRLPPVFVKEVRQSLKGRWFLLTFGMMLFAAWLICLTSVAPMIRGSESLNTGPRVFAAIYIILNVALLLPLPMAAFFSWHLEHSYGAMESLQLTPLTSTAIARGKLSSMALQMGLYLSALLPFLSMTYLLQGISIVDIVVLVTMTLFASASLCIWGSMLGARSRTPLSAFLCCLVLVGSQVVAIWIFAAIGLSFVEPRGRGGMILVSPAFDTLLPVCCMFLPCAAVGGVGYALLIDGIRPKPDYGGAGQYFDVQRMLLTADKCELLVLHIRQKLAALPDDFALRMNAGVLSPMNGPDFASARELVEQIEALLTRRTIHTIAAAVPALRELRWDFDDLIVACRWQMLVKGAVTPSSALLLTWSGDVAPGALDQVLIRLENSSRKLRTAANEHVPGLRS